MLPACVSRSRSDMCCRLSPRPLCTAASSVSISEKVLSGKVHFHEKEADSQHCTKIKKSTKNQKHKNKKNPQKNQKYKNIKKSTKESKVQTCRSWNENSRSRIRKVWVVYTESVGHVKCGCRIWKTGCVRAGKCGCVRLCLHKIDHLRCVDVGHRVDGARQPSDACVASRAA